MNFIASSSVSGIGCFICASTMQFRPTTTHGGNTYMSGTSVLKYLQNVL